jgi:RNA polymerase sigma-70 factor, ECF subfamily
MQGDFDLITKIKNGDNSAFEELVYRYDKSVLSLALKFIKNRDEAKDIYQEVFIRVFRGLKNFQYRSEFSTWLYRITTNVCLTYAKKSKRKNLAEINYDSDTDTDAADITDIPDNNNNYTSPEKYLDGIEFSGRMNEALETLSPKQKMIFILKHYEGYKIREIAVMMNCSDGTVKKYLFEANHKLREQLSEYYV